MEKVLNGKIINEKKVWSANKLYKLFGILMNIGGFLLIGATIYMFFNMTNSEVIGGLFIMPIPTQILLSASGASDSSCSSIGTVPHDYRHAPLPSLPVHVPSW